MTSSSPFKTGHGKMAVNDRAVASTINYYGHGLLKQLADTKPQLLSNSAIKDINYNSFKARAMRLSDHQEVKFYTTAVDFILNNADYLLCQSQALPESPDCSKYGYKDTYQFLPPLDYYLNASRKTRTDQFFKNVRPGDLLICRANQALRSTSQQILKVVAVEGSGHIFLGKGLNLSVYLDLSKTRVPKIDEAGVPNTWLVNTLLRVEVLSVTKSGEEPTAIVGTLGETLSGNKSSIVLGKVTRNDIPAIINACETYTKESVGGFESCLQQLESFKNPRCIQHLAKDLCVSMNNSSLMPSLRCGFPKTGQSKHLRQQQLARWAHKHVADGVAHFKRGNHTEAFQLLSKALNIDPENVEAFVAKGALLANLGSFEKAVKDFESALKFNPHHANARKYICETLLELGKRHEEDSAYGAAEHCYLRSLEVNPQHDGCSVALKSLHGRSGFVSSQIKKISSDGSHAMTNKMEVVTSVPEEAPLEDEIKIADKPDSSVVVETNENENKKEKSLSPFAMKMAMQNNAWAPPADIDTNSSFEGTNSLLRPSEKKEPVVTPFVIGKPSFSTKSTAAEKDKKIAEISKTEFSAETNNKNDTTETKMEDSSQNSDQSKGVQSVTKEDTHTAEDVSENIERELDSNFHSTMRIKPESEEEAESLSVTLLFLSKRYKAINNLVRARLCLEKSLKHNPKHAATAAALRDLTSQNTPAREICTQPITRLYSAPPQQQPPFGPQPVQSYPTYMNQSASQMPVYHRYDPMFSGYIPQVDLHVPPPPVPLHSMHITPMVPPTLSVPPPPLSKWGNAVPPPGASALSYNTQDDREYHDKVDSFLNKIMQRDSSREEKRDNSGRRSPRRVSRSHSRSRERQRHRKHSSSSERTSSGSRSSSDGSRRRQLRLKRDLSVSSRKRSEEGDDAVKESKKKESRRKRKRLGSSDEKSSRSSSVASSKSSAGERSGSEISEYRSRSKKKKPSKAKKKKHKKRSRDNKGSPKTKEKKALDLLAKLDLDKISVFQELDKDVLNKLAEKLKGIEKIAEKTSEKSKEKKRKKDEGVELAENVENGGTKCEELTNKQSVADKNFEDTLKKHFKDEEIKDKEKGKLVEHESRKKKRAKMAEKSEELISNEVKDSKENGKTETHDKDLDKMSKNTSLDIRAVMQLHGLEDLQKKLKDYYSKYEETAHKKTEVASEKIIQEKTIEKQKVSEQKTESSKSKAAVAAEETVQNRKESAEKLEEQVEYGPAPPVTKANPIPKFISTFQAVSAKLQEIQPPLPVPPRVGVVDLFTDILTPKEFHKSKDDKAKKLEDMMSKARSVAEQIGKKKRSSSSRSPVRRSRSQSGARHSRPISRHSRPRSRSRSSSRSRRRYSRSGSKSWDRPRSKSYRSRSRSRRSHSRPTAWRRSGSPRSRSRSFSPRRREFYSRGMRRPRFMPYHRGGGFRGRSRPYFRREFRPYSKSRSRSRSRSYSPRRSPPSRPKSRPRKYLGRSERSESPPERAEKTTMFGKWDKTATESGTIKDLDEMESYLDHAKKKQIDDIKERNKHFLRPS